MEVKNHPAPITTIKGKEMKKDPEAEWRLKVQAQGDINARTVRRLWDAGEGKSLVEEQSLYSQEKSPSSQNVSVHLTERELGHRERSPNFCLYS